MKRFPWILCLGAAVLLAGCAGDSIERDFVAHRARYRAFDGDTGEPSCGGTDMTVYLEGNRIQKIAYSIETSQRLIDRDYYFRDGKPVLVVETTRLLHFDDAKHQKVPRAGHTDKYYMDKPGEVPAEKKSEFETHAAYLADYFSQHRGQFKPHLTS